MGIEQLDLFAGEERAQERESESTPAPVLNGMYYERSTDKYVSFVQGRRHYEEPAKRCGHSKEWQEWMRRERAI